MSGRPRSFGVLPACGRSSRMGRDKLTLPWQGKTLLQTVVAAWSASQVDSFVVVLPRRSKHLAESIADSRAHILVADPAPVDMKATIQYALKHIESNEGPKSHDAVLIAPADLPTLTSKIIDQVLQQHRSTVKSTGAPSILVPTSGQRRGHPILLPWPITQELSEIPADRGIDFLIEQHRWEEVPTPILPTDCDTPSQWESLVARESSG